MKTAQSLKPMLATLALAAFLMGIAPTGHAQEMIDLPPGLESVEKVVAAENLRAMATETVDPEVLLGLGFLVRTGDATRQDILQTAVNARPEYAPVAAVLTITMDGINEESVAALIASDPENALGYYMQGKLLHESDRETEALEAFRKGAACGELRLYEPVTGPALLKALDALGLQGRERLCALSWMASRTSNLGSIGIQHAEGALSELSHLPDTGNRAEVSDLLLVMAGHLFTTNFGNRWYARNALMSAFRIKAEVAAASKSPKMNGYAAVTQALVSVTHCWPGIEEGTAALNVALFLPGRIRRAFSASSFGDWYELSGTDRAAFEEAREKMTAAGAALIDIAVTDPDGIVGPYLMGLPQKPNYEHGPWVSRVTPVEKVMAQRPEVFKAAAEFEAAMAAVHEAARKDARRANRHRLMEMGLGVLTYADKHDNTYPDNIDVLFWNKYLEPPLEAKSLLTGRPYAYVGAGEKEPTKIAGRAQFVVLYDDNEFDGYYDCLFADGHVGSMNVEDLEEQLRKRGK
ncbi:MAG: hypothetical protein ACYTAN_10760 [Planctomycetota bacterium]|jgi:hypothetical protein